MEAQRKNPRPIAATHGPSKLALIGYRHSIAPHRATGHRHQQVPFFELVWRGGRRIPEDGCVLVLLFIRS